MSKSTKNTAIAVALAAAASQVDQPAHDVEVDMPEHTFNDPPQLSVLSEVLIKNAIHNSLRTPSASLKPDFRAFLNHMALMIREALKRTKAEIPALVDVVYALASEGARIDALRLIKGVQGNCLWQASIMVNRDRNPRPARNAPDGLQGAANNEDTIAGMAGSQEAEVPPTEDEAIEALEETNIWLGCLLDLIVIDEVDRDFLSLTDGLEYISEKFDVEGFDKWIPVHDVHHAIELQLVKNENSLKARSARTVQRRESAFEAIKAMYERKAA